MIIILNGPPGCGKDTAADIITKYYNVVHMKFSWPLKRIFDPIFRVGESTALKMVNEGRDVSQPLLNGYTPRQVQMFMFKWLKEYFGPDILGHIAIRELEGVKAPVVVFSDGWGIELEPIISRYGKESVVVLSIERPGHEFGDGGDYRELLNIKQFGLQGQEIQNRFDLEMYEEQVKRVCDIWQLPPR